MFSDLKALPGDRFSNTKSLVILSRNVWETGMCPIVKPNKKILAGMNFRLKCRCFP